VFRNPDTGVVEDGSPFIIYKAADEHATELYKLFFGNKDTRHHLALEAELTRRGIPTSLAVAVPLKSRDLLGELAKQITSQTVLLYLDAFGFKGCEFENIWPFIKRSRRYSTEIMVNLNVADLHRLAACDAIQRNGMTAVHGKNHDVLSAVLNGDWWKPIMLDPRLPKEEKEGRIVRGYTNQFRAYFRYVGSCPVPERDGGQVKYYMTFCSNHEDAIIAHNDNMCAAYNEYVAKTRWTGPLFEGMVDWQQAMIGEHELLDRLIVEQVQTSNRRGIRPTRKTLWAEIISQPDYFMRWREPDYGKRVKLLIEAGSLDFKAMTDSGRLNEHSVLFIPAL
jgi:three-Cys-motif partner protein